jgi:hypothetical protein
LEQSAGFFEAEMVFWLEIMGDHAVFIKESLNPEEQNLILVAENFIKIFFRFLEKSKQISVKESDVFFNDIISALLSLRDFKRELLAARLKNLPVTVLTPTFYNHMLNELDEFLKVIEELISGVQTKRSLLKEHLLWSLDAAGHAAFISGGMDKVEYKLRKEAESFQTAFDQLYLKAVEISGLFRGGFATVQPILEAYNCEVIEIIGSYLAFLEGLKEDILKQKVQGRILFLEPDHMWREGKYYLDKIRLEVGSEIH